MSKFAIVRDSVRKMVDLVPLFGTKAEVQATDTNNFVLE